ncbi:hypothetical protein VNI00_011196 [Paramarasmius palmivorus]|uniref:HNH nuclease domain-containing protein n=1 Tax=Paramarasmius palmivorus TaxID=297713 RepID=A0AAW0CEE3_9AGAR
MSRSLKSLVMTPTEPSSSNITSQAEKPDLLRIPDDVPSFYIKCNISVPAPQLGIGAVVRQYITLRIPHLIVSTITDHTLRWVFFMLWCIVPEAGELSTGTRKLTLSSTYHPADGEVLYYKVDYKKGFIADPAAMIERTSTSEAKQTRDSRYRSNIMKRDEVEVYHEGKRYKYPYCVLSERTAKYSPYVAYESYASGCHAAHLIPHAKHDHYIAFMTGGEIEKIDDVRNGLLVLKQLHTCLGASGEGKNKTPPVCSFLKVPNRFLKRSHIKISKKQPDLDKIPPAKSSPTVHFHVLSVMAKLYAPPLCDMLINEGQIWDGKLVRQPLPENREEKIPDSLLNYHYGCVALTVFAQRDVGDFQKFSKTVQEIYELGGGPYMDKKSGKDRKRGGGGGGGEGEQGEEGAGDKGKGKAAQNQEEDVEQSEMGLVDTLWALSALVRQSKKIKRSNDAIKGWRDGIPSSAFS